MADAVQLELVTPESAFFSGAVAMVEAPGAEGDFGVLPNHAPFVSLLRPGIVTIHNDGDVQKLFVTSGLAQVDSEKCVILAEEVHSLADMTETKAADMLKSATKHLHKCQKEQTDTATAEKQVAACEVLVETVKAA